MESDRVCGQDNILDPERYAGAHWVRIHVRNAAISRRCATDE